jgi:hypothetical protein
MFVISAAHHLTCLANSGMLGFMAIAASVTCRSTAKLWEPPRK